MSLNKLKTHLSNLKSNGEKTITLDVEYLIDVLGIVVPGVKPEEKPSNTLDVDGDKFEDDT